MEHVETLAAGAVIYLAPFFIAVLRSHKNAMAIGALNLLLGWTILGWIGALIWSMTSNVKTSEELAENRKRKVIVETNDMDELSKEGWIK